MFHHATLDNGLTVLAELHPSMQAAAAGFFVRAGSRDEAAEDAGVSHFLEHMAFKGAGAVTADDVNRRFDEIGASYNASTSEETTLYYAAVLPEYLPAATDLLATLMRPDLRTDDFETEKQVILEEIGMYDDMPHFVAYERLMAAHFAGHPLGNSVLGSVESVTGLTAERMRAYHASRYAASNIVLAVSGNTSWDEVRRLAGERCGSWAFGEKPVRDTSEATPPGGDDWCVREDQMIQTISQAAAAPAARDRLRTAAELVSVAVGDDSGSRLYWELVDGGEAESAELGYSDYEGSGAWMTYLSSGPKRTAECLDRIAGVYQSVNRDGLSDDELRRAKNKALSRLVLQAERPMGRLGSVSTSWVARDEYKTLDGELAEVEAVTAADVRELLDRYPLAQTTTAGVGPLSGP